MVMSIPLCCMVQKHGHLIKKIERKINAFEMWTFRRMGKVSWKDKKTNEEVCTTLNIRPELLKTIKSRKLKYFGHTKRHGSVCRQIMDGKVEGKRKRGRPLRTWIDDVKNWTG